MSRYRVSARTEHGCCWGASVEDTSKPTMIGDEHYNGEYEMVCECRDADTAQKIATALNQLEQGI